MSGAPTKPGWAIALEDRQRKALIEEARGWRKVGQWVEGWPRRLNGAQLSGIACALTGDSDVAQDMSIRNPTYSDNPDDPRTYHDPADIAGYCYWVALECADEAQALARQSGRTQKKKGGRK